MNHCQKLALKALEKAFAKCRTARLVFHGMDGDLLVYDADELEAIVEVGSVCDEQYKKNGNQGEKVDTHKTYYDSGGW